jgi:hypothetical protein
MTTVKAWLASAALVGGAGGGVAAGIAATGGATQPAAAARPVTAAADTRYLQQEVDALLKEDRALKAAIHRAGLRLAAQVRAGEKSLAELHRRIVAAQNALAQAQTSRNQVAGFTPSAPAAVTPAPSAHATTGASGAGTGTSDGGENDGGDDG